MSLHRILLLVTCILFSRQGVFGQFQVGYGIGLFPNGMSSLYTEQSFFLESSYAEKADGPLTKKQKMLPFHHGLSVAWQSGQKKKHKADVILKWSNLHNSHSLERTNTATSAVTAFNKKSRVNNYIFGGVFHLDNRYIKSWSLSGLLSQHTIMHKPSGKGWTKSAKTEGDFGIDAGLQLASVNNVAINVHYTKCFFMFSAYNPSFFGVEIHWLFKK
ncbi:MAG: hypothetical protein JNL57_11100 [Bacteroidetes bacterium]|nr:hypothetical protein [Bacteroidota bacterium]